MKYIRTYTRIYHEMYLSCIKYVCILYAFILYGYVCAYLFLIAVVNSTVLVHIHTYVHTYTYARISVHTVFYYNHTNVIPISVYCALTVVLYSPPQGEGND